MQLTTGIYDKHDVQINEGDCVLHNNKSYEVVKPFNVFHRGNKLILSEIGNTDNWRDIGWLERVSQYVTVYS